jgi:transcription antitermination factor NusG
MREQNGWKRWYALYTRPRQEFKAEIQINASGIETYLPLITQVKQWSDRKKKVTEPILRGYIFINATERERLIALEQPAVVRCVSERGKPAVIPEGQIENLKAFVREESQYRLFEGLIKGTRVRITDGPFHGVEGVVVQDSDGKSLAVTIELLNRSILTYISDKDKIEVLKVKKS